MAAKNTNRNKKGSGNARSKPFFEDHWPLELVRQSLASGQLIEGTIRVNPKNFEESFILHPVSQLSFFRITSIRMLRSHCLNFCYAVFSDLCCCSSVYMAYLYICTNVYMHVQVKMPVQILGLFEK